MKRWFTMFALLGMVLFAEGQRRYAAVSVLSAGQWTKVSVDHQGIYKVSAAFLKNAGLTTAIPSANIRIFGTGGGVLPESNQQAIADFRKILTATNPFILSILRIPQESASQKCLWYRIPAQ